MGKTWLEPTGKRLSNEHLATSVKIRSPAGRGKGSKYADLSPGPLNFHECQQMAKPHQKSEGKQVLPVIHPQKLASQDTKSRRMNNG